jgi:hypothetical protein
MLPELKREAQNSLIACRLSFLSLHSISVIYVEVTGSALPSCLALRLRCFCCITIFSFSSFSVFSQTACSGSASGCICACLLLRRLLSHMVPPIAAHIAGHAAKARTTTGLLSSCFSEALKDLFSFVVL